MVKSHVRRVRSDGGAAAPYNILQRLTYTAVVFVLMPLMIATGLAMSPAVTSVVPAVVTVFGGQQSARTIHFFVACALTIFVLAHVALVWQAGFATHLRAMITGRDRSRRNARKGAA